MPTPFDSIEDLALIEIRDYKIDKLAQQSEVGLQTYLDSFLISAIPNFTRCRQSLSYDLAARQFSADLTLTEQSILADYWVIEWFSKEVNDSTQIQNKLQISSAFTTHSSAQNLKEKSAYLDKLREEVDWKVTQYQLTGLPYPNAESAPYYFEGW